jgi:hypothetical protein
MGGRQWQSSRRRTSQSVNVIDREVKLDHRRPGSQDASREDQGKISLKVSSAANAEGRMQLESIQVLKVKSEESKQSRDSGDHSINHHLARRAGPARVP